MLLSVIAKISLNLFLSNQSVVFLSSSGLFISIGFSTDSLILASTFFFFNCSFCSFLTFSFSLFVLSTFLLSTFSFFFFFYFLLFYFLLSHFLLFLLFHLLLLIAYFQHHAVISFSSLKITSDIKINSFSSQITS